MSAEAKPLLGSCRTGLEIAGQPEVWRGVEAVVTRHRNELDTFVAGALADPNRIVVLTGAGTSAFVGELVVGELGRRLRHHIRAVPTTDIVAAPDTALQADRSVLLVSFARSGDSPESSAVVALADELTRDVRHLVITCNADGELAAACRRRDDALVLVLPPESNDQGFAMTSSFTGMALAALLTFGVPLDVEALAAAGDVALGEAAALVDDLLQTHPHRLVYLGSGAMKGLAHESALKCLELTAGRVLAVGEASMGFRHGPKSMLDEDTLAVVYLSNQAYTRNYDLDIARELARAIGADRVVVVDGIGTADVSAVRWHVAGVAGMPDAAWALVAVMLAQTLALAASLREGITPDNPFPDGEVNRVVQGVVIHPLGGNDGC